MSPATDISYCRPQNFNADEISQLIIDSAIGLKDTDYSESAWEGFIESYNASTVEKLIKDPKQKFIIAIKKNKIIGIIGISESQISELFVHPDFQKTRIATKLLIRLLEETDGTVTVNITSASRPTRLLSRSLLRLRRQGRAPITAHGSSGC
jgi:GNAT superfamily N-acetyltransferase